jgi:hypothetical protein
MPSIAIKQTFIDDPTWGGVVGALLSTVKFVARVVDTKLVARVVDSKFLARVLGKGA